MTGLVRTSRSKLEIRAAGAAARMLRAGFVSNGQRGRRDQLNVLPPRRGAVVLLGDSITEQGEWTELLSHLPVANRGVGGEVTTQLLQRVDAALNDPAAVVILIGTNDLSIGRPPRAIAANVGRLLDRVAILATDSPVIVQSVPPRRARFAEEIREINWRLQETTAARRVHYLDLWPVLSDGADSLRPDFTFDGLHLNGAGYLAWANVLSSALSRLGVEGPR